MNVYKPINFKHGVIFASAIHHSLILVWSTWAYFQSHRGTRKPGLQCLFSRIILNRPEENQVCCWDMMVWWPSLILCFTWLLFLGYNLTLVIVERERERETQTDRQTDRQTEREREREREREILHSDVYEMISFKRGKYIVTAKPFSYMPIWMTVILEITGTQEARKVERVYCSMEITANK